MLILTISTFSQETGYKISKKILLINDTIKIDTLSIVPETFLMFDSLGNLISKDIYKIDYPNSILYLLPPAKVFINSYVEIKYQTFPFNFYQVFKNKNLLQQNENKEYDLKYNLNNYDNPFFDDVYAKDELQKIGSISRAISFGNSQDMSVSSGFNLQLSGKLTDDVRILAAITDKNIPIQPEGNTAQIQEFDKVFIQLMTNKSSVIAGDFEVYSGKTYFMKYYKKVRGGLVNTTLIDKKNDSSSFKLVTAAAIAKGKYARNYITPIEGNQGPYKLKGIDNESYIVILAGSEKVFINGQLLTRGKDNDYIIDYNNAEIYFTPKNLITQEKRIIVEFEYSERNYLRTMFITNTYYDTKKININFNLFSEQEHKNQPIQQNLSNESKQILAKAGDSLELTFVPDIEKTTFNTNEILYKMVDTIVAGIVYDSIFVFSTNPDSACYRVKFTDLGPGKGNYVQMISPVNGRVFKWVAPVNGVCQGNWEPVNSLIAPQTKQMFDCQINFKVNQKMTVGLETAISNYDKNTFSSLNDNNNVGNATKVWINKNFDLPSLKSKNWKFNTLATYEREGNNFTPIERYKTPEFERDWNIISNNSGNKHFSSLKFEFNNSQNGNKLGYDLSTLIISNSHYSSLRNNIYGNIFSNYCIPF